MKFFHRSASGDSAFDQANKAEGNLPVVQNASARTPRYQSTGGRGDILGQLYAGMGAQPSEEVDDPYRFGCDVG